MIHTENIFFQIGTFRLQDISLEIAPGEYFVLLGPPGSGKSIFLECLCGLKRIHTGRIYIDGQEVTTLAPRSRHIGYVPQDYALFPHLSVEGNIAFGMRCHGFSKREISRRVSETAEMLHIRALLPRRTQGLSGGEQQRVALARALVLQPKVLLLDEPVCALDEVTRQEVCTQLLSIQRELGLATIHVSHNQEEAFSVADQAGIFHEGQLMQRGDMDHMLRRPQNEFVARFMRCENIFHGTATPQKPPSQTTVIQCGSASLHIPGRHEGPLSVMIRPEDVLISLPTHPTTGSKNVLSVTLSGARDYGNYVRLELEGPVNLVAHIAHQAYTELNLQLQSDLVATLPSKLIHILPE